jgi:hypothetical protein
MEGLYTQVWSRLRGAGDEAVVALCQSRLHDLSNVVGLGFKVWNPGFTVWGLGLRAQGLGLRFQDLGSTERRYDTRFGLPVLGLGVLGFGVLGFVFRVWGSRFGVQGSRFRV